MILLVATALSAILGHAVEAVAITVIVVFAVVLGLRAGVSRRARDRGAAQHGGARRRACCATATRSRSPARERRARATCSCCAPATVLPRDARLLEAVNLEVQEGVAHGRIAPGREARRRRSPTATLADRRPREHGLRGHRGDATAAAVRLVVAHRDGDRVRAHRRTARHGRGGPDAAAGEPRPARARCWRARRSRIVVVIVALGVIRGQPFVEMLVFGIALAVAVVPEALPAVVTISLALGVQRLVKRRRADAPARGGRDARQHVGHLLRQDRHADPGRDDRAHGSYVAGTRLDVTGSGYAPRGGVPRSTATRSTSRRPDGLAAAAARRSCGAARARERRALARDADDGAWTLTRRSDRGRAGRRRGEGRDRTRPTLDAAHAARPRDPVHLRVPADDDAACAPDGSLVAYAKGAPEVIARRLRVACARPDGDVPLDERRPRAASWPTRPRWRSDALRVLAVARRGRRDARRRRDGDLTFLGLVGMIDPPRDGGGGPRSRRAKRPASASS